MDSGQMRVDRWLWAVRVFRTRSAAIEACRAGHVKVGGVSVKPAREVRIGDEVLVQIGPVTRTLKVLALLERRVGAKQVPAYLEDRTPPAEWAKRGKDEAGAIPTRDRGSGRPTKRERRVLDRFMDLPVDRDRG